MKTQNCILAGLALAMVVTLGCGKADVRDKIIAEVNQNNIQRMANLYTYYQSQNKWAGPIDEADFKEFIKQVDPRSLTRMGIDTNAIDSVFVSERDNEPFQIKYGIPTGPHGSTEPAIFEKTGQDGKRMVAFLNMTQKEVEASEYDSLFGSEIDEEPEHNAPAHAGDSRSGG